MKDLSSFKEVEKDFFSHTIQEFLDHVRRPTPPARVPLTSLIPSLVYSMSGLGSFHVWSDPIPCLVSDFIPSPCQVWHVTSSQILGLFWRTIVDHYQLLAIPSFPGHSITCSMLYTGGGMDWELGVTKSV